jgi:hypothetical protein
LPQSIAAQQGEHVVPFGGNFHATNVIKFTLNGFLELEQYYPVTYLFSAIYPGFAFPYN